MVLGWEVGSESSFTSAATYRHCAFDVRPIQCHEERRRLKCRRAVRGRRSKLGDARLEIRDRCCPAKVQSEIDRLAQACASTKRAVYEAFGLVSLADFTTLAWIE